MSAIQAADIPNNAANTSGTAAGLSATLALTSGGTSQTSAQGAINTLAGAVTNANYLRGNGTNVVMSAIQAADIPNNAANTTGSAGSLSATLALTSGGTSQTSAQGAINTLAGAVTNANYLRGNGTNVVMSAIQAADIPNNAANTTGSAGSLSTTFTIGYVLYGQGTGVPAASSGHYWDNTTGRLGIGRTDPPYKFSVDNGSTTGPAAFVQASGITAGQGMSLVLGKTNTTNNAGTILWNHVGDGLATNYLGLGYWGGDNKLNITAAGNVGIGITNPTSYTLQVTGTIGSTGDITAFTSDERLKSKTGPLVDALDKVCTLDTFTYTHNDLARSFGFTDKRQYVGISAQQVRKVQPEVVRIAPFDADGEGSKSGQEYITVQYERLVPLLIEALKEERKAREALEVSLGTTTRELRSLEERIKLLEQK
jgi:hypothetical protein